MACRQRGSLIRWVVGLITFLLPAVSGVTYTVHVSNAANNTYYPVIPPPGFNISTLTRLNFSVQTCNDAHLLLSQDGTGGQPLFEIVIGGWSNKKSVIRDKKQQRPVLREINHPVRPLNCNEFRAFFASWKNGEVRVGSVMDDATKNESVFLDYDYPSPFPIHFAFVGGWNRAGDWIFKFTADDVTTVVSTMTTLPTTTEMTSASNPSTAITEVSTTSTDVAKVSTTSTEVTEVSTTRTDVTEVMTASSKVTEVSTTSTDVTEVSTTSTDVTKVMTTSTDVTKVMTTSTHVTKVSTTSTDVTKIMTTRTSDTTTQSITRQPDHCSCRCRLSLNASRIEPQDPAQIVSELLIPSNSTSAARRRLTSATDDRPSSIAIGAVGVVCLLCPILMTVCMDVTTFYKPNTEKQDVT